MAEKTNPLSAVTLKYRRSSTLTKIVVLTAIVLSIAALLTLHSAINSARNATEDLRTEAIGLEQENSRLELYIRELGTIQGIIRIAQEELGLVEPGSILIQPE